MTRHKHDHKKLFTLPTPLLDSEVAGLVVGLETLRSRELSGTTPPWIFFGVKNLFQTVESVISTHIEGNNTTIAAYVEAARSNKRAARDEKIKMILNLEKTLKDIEKEVDADTVFDKGFILDLHRKVVDGLDASQDGEGDTRPGAYRNEHREIQNSKHVLPQHTDIRDLMDRLITFINMPVPHTMELVKIAIVHHRLVWIHPFGNGNGRVVRLLTYAMLTRAGYIDKDGARLLDPTAVFGSNKLTYYDKLAGADDLSEQGATDWCEYMLSGLTQEINKIDQLLDGDFTKREIIVPAIMYAHEKQKITKLERDMLLICVGKNLVAANDFRDLFPANTSHVRISQVINKLKEQNLIEASRPGARKYMLCMNNNLLTTGILRKLDENGFLPPLQPGVTNQTV
ncbi:MAG TPA: Fic family protein [Candidatus Saccharimonadales bacterium]|nr:Fic family protein [Candidatus Saccharimonadales bacterium]